MNYTLKIKKCLGGWDWTLSVPSNTKPFSSSEIFNSAEAALEAGSKKLLELLPKETFDFGQGPVPAHRHPWGDGWVADTAKVADTVYVGSNACVYEFAKVCGCARIDGNARVFGHAEVYGQAYICENAHVHGKAKVYEFAKVCGNVTICAQIVCGHKHLNDSDEKYVLISDQTLGCWGPFNSPGEASEAMVPGVSYKIRELEKP